MEQPKHKIVTLRELLQRRFNKLSPSELEPSMSEKRLGIFEDKTTLERGLCKSVFSQLEEEPKVHIAVATAQISNRPEQVMAYRLVYTVPHQALIRLQCTSHDETKHFYCAFLYDNIQPERFRECLPIPTGKLHWPISSGSFDQTEIPLPTLFRKTNAILVWPIPNRSITDV